MAKSLDDLPGFDVGTKQYKWNPDNQHIYKLNLATGSWDKISKTAASLDEAKEIVSA